MQARSDEGWAVAAAVIVPAVVIAGLLGSLVMFAAVDAAACTPSRADSGAAVSVDPDDVPNGPIAGYSGEQLVNAAVVMGAIADLGMSKRDQQLAVMTAMGESSLQVLDYGDAAGPDSRGLFQQRANGAWGSYADRMDPYISATNFGKALRGIRDRDQLDPTIAVHRVQRNADPHYYTQFWSPALTVVDTLAGIATDTTAPPSGGGKRTTSYDVGPVTPAVQALANTLGAKFDLTDIGGWRADGGGYNDHPSGHALDLMVYNNKAKGDAIAAYLQANADTFGVSYLIWYQRIWNAQYRADEGWRPMEDRGSATANHLDHVHVTLLDSATPITNAPGGANCVPTATVTGGWAQPVDANWKDTYGPRIHPITGAQQHHNGTDVGGGCDAPIYAAAAGKVTYAGPSGGYGNLIDINHGTADGKEVHTRYGHMFNNGVLVRAGDTVVAGQQIAKIGNNGMSTACHLHFEVTLDGDYTNPYTYVTDRIADATDPATKKEPAT